MSLFYSVRADGICVSVYLAQMFSCSCYVIFAWSMGKSTFHSNIAIIHITIPEEQVKIQMTKSHSAWIVLMINDVMLILIVCILTITRHALPQCPHLSRPNYSSLWVDSLMQFGQIKRRSIHVSDTDWHLIPGMFYWVHVWTHSWSVHDLGVLLVQKCHCVTCYMWWGSVLYKHKFLTEHPSLPWQHVIPQNLDVVMPIHHPIQNNQVAPSAMIDWAPEHDWFPWFGWMQSLINLSDCLRCTQALPSLWYRENLNSSLKMQCLQWRKSQNAPLAPFTMTSPMHQSQSWTFDRTPELISSSQESVRAIMCLPKSHIICILTWGAEMKRFILTIQCKWWSSQGVDIFCWPSCFLWLSRPHCPLCCRTLLAQPCAMPRNLTLRIALWRQQDNLPENLLQ